MLPARGQPCQRVTFVPDASNPLLTDQAAHDRGQDHGCHRSTPGQGQQAYVRHGEPSTPPRPAGASSGQKASPGPNGEASPPIPAHGATGTPTNRLISPFADPLIQQAPFSPAVPTLDTRKSTARAQQHVRQAAGLLDRSLKFHIRIQLAPGAASRRITSSDVHKIRKGAHLWDNLRSSTVTSFPDELEGAHYVLSRGEDELSTNPNYLTATFSEDTAGFVLLHSATKVPSWLSERFVRVPERDVELKWRFTFLSSVSYFLADSYKKMTTSTLKLWRLKEGFIPAGEPLVLGGAEAVSLSEINYIFCWKKHEPGTMLERLVTNEAAGRSFLTQKGLNEALEKAVLSDDIQTVRILLEKGADVTITITCTVPRGALLTNAAAAAQNMSMVCCLVLHGAELDWIGLEYVIHQCMALPRDHGPLEAFLVRYVRSHRNPINSSYAIAYALRSASRRLPAKAKEFMQLCDSFRHTAITLVEELRRLEDFSGAFTHSVRGHLTAGKVLEPTQFHSPLYPINLANTRKISTRMHDTEFTSTSVVQEYIDRSWKGEVYSLMTGDDVEMSTSNDKFIRNSLRQVGFTGSLGSTAFGRISQLLHVLIFASRSFFNSPRGRWCFRVYTQGLFMTVFHLALFIPKGPDRFSCDEDGSVVQVQTNSVASTLSWLMDSFAPQVQDVSTGLLGNSALFWVLSSLLSLWATGMMVDFYHVLRYQYGGSLKHLLKQGQSYVLFELFLGVLLFVSVGLWGATELRLTRLLTNDGTRALVLSQLCTLPALSGRLMNVYRPMKAVFSTAAFFSWLQTLLVIRPISKNLGPLVYVMGKMLLEVLFFMVPMGILLLGFASALFSLFSDQSNQMLGLYNFGDVCMFLFLFFIGEFRFDVFYQPEECTGNAINCPDATLRAFGLAILVIYTILGTILMANLLIAILTYKYDPDKIDAENFFHRQLTLDNYQEQVDNHLLPAPFSPFLVVSYQFASGTRRRLPPSSFARWMLPALDGNLLADENHHQVVTGASEVPYIIFIFWFWPVLLLAAVSLAIIMMGYSVLHFALATAKRLDYSIPSAKVHPQEQERQFQNGLRQSAGRTHVRRLGMLKSLKLGLGRRLEANWRHFQPVRMLQFGAVVLSAAIGGTIIYVSMLSLFTIWTLLWVMPCTLVFHSFWVLSGMRFIPSGVVAGVCRILCDENGVPAKPRSSTAVTPIESTDSAPGSPLSSTSVGYRPRKPGRAWGRILKKYRLQRWKVFDDTEVDAALLGQGLRGPQLILTHAVAKEIGAQASRLSEDGNAEAAQASMDVLASGAYPYGSPARTPHQRDEMLVSSSEPQVELGWAHKHDREPASHQSGLGRVPSYHQHAMDSSKSNTSLSIMVPHSPKLSGPPGGIPRTPVTAHQHKSPYNMPPKTPKARAKAKAKAGPKGRGQAGRARNVLGSVDNRLADADPWASGAAEAAAVQAAVVEHVAPMQETVLALLQSQQQAIQELRAEVAAIRGTPAPHRRTSAA